MPARIAAGLTLCAAVAASAQDADPNKRWQDLQRAQDQLGQEKRRIAPLRASDARRYATEWRTLLERHEAQVRSASDIPQSVGARQSLAREYTELGGLLRFRLAQPDAAIAAYDAATRSQASDAFDFAALLIADTYRFDKRDARKAAEHYRRGVASLAKGTWAGPDRMVAAALRQWIDREIDYLENGRRFSGAIGRGDMTAGQLWVMLASGQEPLHPIPDARALASLPPSQVQIARVYPGILEFEPAEMLAFFARHDPSGYLTAAILAGAQVQMPSPFVVSAAQTFFRSRGIHGPSTAADPRYASAEKTWAAFLAAAKNGDAAAMLDCFTLDMQARLEELFKRMSREERRAMGASFVAFTLQGEGEAMIVRQHKDRRQAGFVTFVNDGGGWKIASM